MSRRRDSDGWVVPFICLVLFVFGVFTLAAGCHSLAQEYEDWKQHIMEDEAG